MASIRDTLREAVSLLEVVSESPDLDAEILLGHALDYTRTQLLTRSDDPLPESDFAELLQRRLNHEPVAYIVGDWEFYSLPIRVEPPVLVPRPETEHLVEWALELLPKGDARALDIGTGTGCIPIAITKHHSTVNITSVDIKATNLKLARRNAELNQVSDRIKFIESDLFESVEERGPFDLICSNPPYIPDADWSGLADDIRNFEDRDALLAGVDGLDIVRRIVSESQVHLKPGGHLLMEIGHDQAETVSALLEENGFTDVGFRKDLAGIDRVALGRKPA